MAQPGGPDLLVSVRGPNEALDAATGGATRIDVIGPATPIGTPYPLNLYSIKGRLLAAQQRSVRISAPVSAEHASRAAAAQAALGLCAAGADVVRFAVVDLTLGAAAYLGDSIVRTVRSLGGGGRHVVPVVYVDRAQRRFFQPFREGPELARRCGADGLMVDTHDRLAGRGLLDDVSIEEIATFATEMHEMNMEAWVGGGIGIDAMDALRASGVDVVCVRRAACGPPARRTGAPMIDAWRVHALVERLSGASAPHPAPMRGQPNSL